MKVQKKPKNQSTKGTKEKGEEVLLNIPGTRRHCDIPCQVDRGRHRGAYGSGRVRGCLSRRHPCLPDRRRAIPRRLPPPFPPGGGAGRRRGETLATAAPCRGREWGLARRRNGRGAGLGSSGGGATSHSRQEGGDGRRRRREESGRRTSPRRKPCRFSFYFSFFSFSIS